MENHVKNSLRRSYIIRVKSLTHMVIFHKLKDIWTSTLLNKTGEGSNLKVKQSAENVASQGLGAWYITSGGCFNILWNSPERTGVSH